MFSTGEFVKLTVTCPNLDVQGVKDKYKPNSDGVVEVSGITLSPNGSGKVQYGRDQTVRVDVTGIDYNNYVTFPVRIKAGEYSGSRALWVLFLCNKSKWVIFEYRVVRGRLNIRELNIKARNAFETGQSV